MGVIIRNGIEYSGAGMGGGSCDCDEIVYLTQEEYDALPASKESNNVEYRITNASESVNAARDWAYDNSESGLEAETVQDAIDEINNNLYIKTYYNVNQLGITSWFIPDIINAMPNNSRFCCDVADGIRNDERNKLPLTLGVLTIDKPNNSRHRVMFNYSASGAKGQIYIASIDIPNLVVNNWYQFTHSSKGDLTSIVTSDYCTINSCSYQIIGEMAILSLIFTTNSEVPAKTVLLDNIPLRPSINGMTVPLYKYGSKDIYYATVVRGSANNINNIATFDTIPSGTTFRTEIVFSAIYY